MVVFPSQVVPHNRWEEVQESDEEFKRGWHHTTHSRQHQKEASSHPLFHIHWVCGTIPVQLHGAKCITSAREGARIQLYRHKTSSSSVSKRGIWWVYYVATEEDGTVHTVAYSTFCKLWKTLVPSIVIMKPMSDLCWQCHQNSAALLWAANRPEEEKTITIREPQKHLRVVQLEKSYYKTTCDECHASVTSHFTTNDVFSLPSPFSAVVPVTSIKVYYSFDYAQQVHYPSDPVQPGPIYFLTPCKCTIFGVNCEAIPRQINFLMDKAGDCGKGANAVISRLDYFFWPQQSGREGSVPNSWQLYWSK